MEPFNAPMEPGPPQQYEDADIEVPDEEQPTPPIEHTPESQNGSNQQEDS